MDVNSQNAVPVSAGVFTALHAGLLYDFGVDTVPAFRSVNGHAHISTMQAINAMIENPVSFMRFFGPISLLPSAPLLRWGRPQFIWLLTASVIQIFDCEGVMEAGNIPLEKKFVRIDADKLPEAETDRIRIEFQGRRTPRMRFHTIRTPAAITATTINFIACLST
jgi:uncharacterized membrane protein